MALKFIYIANIFLAGWISVASLFFPKSAHVSVFTQGFAYSEAIRLVGALWAAILVLSVLGLFFPYQMSPVLLLQLIYKSLWLLVAALPAALRQEPYPKYMAAFFILWVLVLPFVIPWNTLFKSGLP